MRDRSGGSEVPAASARLRRPGVAWPALAGLAGGVVLLLLSVAGRYGYHRDELYFLARAGSRRSATWTSPR